MAKLASATLSLFQSIMYRPGMAPSLTGTMPEMGAWLSTMPPTCWPRLLGACISWGAISRRSRQPGASTRSLKAGSPSISSRRSAPSWEWICFERSRRSSFGSPRALPRSWMMPFTE